ncbi:DUF2332 domain-containing protein [Anianabacter salinae]|uniref:DUF2332 domain-containing protein n=1 Tax=Anianabacter salinae TaxID=2851023 RepID=UPI00225E439F|nr:DUF2332 family protein [Anianabacter salinae]MBV0912742.1 DUF2332 family protein [Anianabacter salinae]
MSVRAAFEAQARACAALGSPFTARLCTLAADRLDRDTAVGRMILDWPGDPSNMADSVPLRFCGVLHRLVLRGDPGLAPHWPPHDPGDDALWAAVIAALDLHAETLADWVRSPPQTNEVRRAAAMIPALHLVAAAHGLPLALHELGASAGLNLLADHFSVQAGDSQYGPADAEVRLVPDWTGKAPPPAELVVASRRGVDLRPVQATVTSDRERLLSYLWPDQPERLARTEAALALARRTDLAVDQGDAGAWLAKTLQGTARDECAVVVHTVAWQYFPEPTRAAALAAMHSYGTDRPLARISMEADGDQRGAGLSLTLWPGGRTLALGRADFHGRWVDWTGPAAI